ncbi:hypothetical protein L2E82_11799 [Cichorium intybus]|uniref:Uncharacterized protein n=1 Tax=Cichorium intybus TaxID=13427 RepID=A0ACB9GFH2_CICIN|nr:hypothetical protein L2E82_11799 [Cichorium intybus]
MMDGVAEVMLPFSIERLIENICLQKLLPMPDVAARKTLSKISEESAIDVLKRVSSTTKPIYNLSGYIVYLVNRYGSVASTSSHGDAESIRLSSQYPSSPSSSASSTPRRSAVYDSPSLKQFLESPSSCKSASPVNNRYRASTNGSHGGLVQEHTSSFSFSSLKDAIPTYCPSVEQLTTSPTSSSKNTNPNHVDPANASQSGSSSYYISDQAMILSGLEFRKLFMVHSYIGRKKLEDAVSVEDAIKIDSMKTMSMFDFEDWMWNKFGCHYCQSSDRVMYLDWDSGKTHLYSCYVSPDGGYQFKGPYLDRKKTHLQRAIGDENVLIVKFAEADKGDMMAVRNYEKIFEAGILVGWSRFRFFVFKDGGKERQKNGKDDNKRVSSGSIKCYFVKRESIAPWDDTNTCLMMNRNTVHDARCLFMHVHMVSSMAKYIARFSLILSTTIKLQVDLASVSIQEIEDIPCIDENGYIVCDEDGEPLIQTDGTGFISEDLAVLVPHDFYDAKFMKDQNYEKFDLVQPEIGGERDVPVKDPPLLIQCRLYNEGSAVKGTLLVNKKLKPRTIHVRPSMIKVKKDPRLSDIESFNSMEIVAVSHKPKAAKLSKHLIALLTIGGVPKEYFLGLLETTLKDAQRVCFDPRAAFRVASIYQHIDDSGICMEMFGARIPLNEPFFQHRLSQLAKEERKGLGEGKIPINESFYLMGTTDPTGILNRDEVCIILENGQISGKVLVYRNPGLHFGDIHVLNARYVKQLEDYIGNGKFAIFFSTKGKRSVANEIANGDFDGDMYWVSRNPQLLHYFKASEPWTRGYSTPSGSLNKPSDFSYEELEHELFKLLFLTKSHSEAAGIAADSWMSFMDQYLMLQDDDVDEKHLIEKKMLKLIDLYYDALDAAKSGKKVVIPRDLKATKYPHHMGRKPEYHSTSILGLIYDQFQSCKNDKLPVQEIWKLPYFETSVPDLCLNIWKERYESYKKEMSNALKYNDLSKNDAANSVIQKYKQLLYGGLDFKDSTRNIDHIYNEALAIYHVCYDYARRWKDIAKCGFAWKVAGSALCAYHRKIHCMKTGEREITFVSSAFDGIF